MNPVNHLQVPQKNLRTSKNGCRDFTSIGFKKSVVSKKNPRDFNESILERVVRLDKGLVMSFKFRGFH
jgi:hypothetical protein